MIKHPTTPAVGIAYIVIGSATLAACEAVTKYMTSSHPVGQVLFVRGCIVLIILTVLRKLVSQRFLPTIHSFPGVLLRTILAVSSSVLFVTSIALMPLAHAVALAMTGPIFTAYFASRLLLEGVSPTQWAAIAVGFVGMIFMVRPNPSTFEWVVVIPLLAALSGAFRDITTRYYGTVESGFVMLWLATFGTILVGAGSLLFVEWHPVSNRDFILFLASSILLALAHYCLIEGFRVAPASTVSPFRYTHLLWAMILSYLIWRDFPSLWTAFGSLLVVISAILLSRLGNPQTASLTQLAARSDRP